MAGPLGQRPVRHRPTQIATDSSTKLALRIVPIARRERAAGRPAAGCSDAVAAWTRLLLAGPRVEDAAEPAVRAAASAADPVRGLVGLLDAELAADPVFVDTVRAATT